MNSYNNFNIFIRKENNISFNIDKKTTYIIRYEKIKRDYTENRNKEENRINKANYFIKNYDNCKIKQNRRKHQIDESIIKIIEFKFLIMINILIYFLMIFVFSLYTIVKTLKVVY